MTDTSVAVPGRSASPPDDKPKRMQIRGKLAEAIDLMIEEGMPWQNAAKKVGFTTYTMRKWLDRPHVIAHIRTRKQILRERLSASNIHRLCEIRDAGNNMPAVQAIRELERDDATNNAGRSALSQVPGFTIIISNGTSLTAHERQIDAKPLISLDCGHTDPVRPGRNEGD